MPLLFHEKERGAEGQLQSGIGPDFSNIACKKCQIFRIPILYSSHLSFILHHQWICPNIVSENNIFSSCNNHLSIVIFLKGDCFKRNLHFIRSLSLYTSFTKRLFSVMQQTYLSHIDHLSSTELNAAFPLVEDLALSLIWYNFYNSFSRLSYLFMFRR